MKNILLSMAAVASLLHAGGDVVPSESLIADTAPESTWNYEFQLYGLAIWIDGDATIGALPSGKVDESPKSIIDKLEMGAMVHAEAHQNDGWGVWLDYVFMNLGAGATLDKSFVHGDANVGIYQGILEAFATYRVPMEKGYMDYYGGVRWWHNAFDLTTSLSVPGVGSRNSYRERTIDWYDPVLGARWTYPIYESWSFRVRGDVGGFGIQSDFSAAIEVGALYDINENWQVDLRFKSLWVDYEEGSKGTQDYFAYDTINFGPIIGITYKF